MARWFETKSEDNNLRKYSKRRLGDNSIRQFFRKFSITNWIIFVNVIVYLFILFLIPVFGLEKIVSVVGLEADKFFSGSYWTVFTSMFVHIEAWHILANMVSLFFIGNFVEKLIGRKRFFWLYILSGLFAGLLYVFLSYYFGASIIGAKLFGSPSIFAVGASGAIFSLLGILAFLTPYTKVYLIAGPVIALILQSVFSSIFPNSSILPILDTILTVYVFISIFSMFSFNSKMMKIALPLKMPFWLLPIIAIVPLVLIGLFVDLPIGNSAHFGGLIAGLCYGFYLRKKYKQKTDMMRRYFSN
ncbi:Rhomboid protease GlpG [uncultured archaeon]|nr:Rhomboid protease GlpG [uncultured archaeon]